MKVMLCIELKKAFRNHMFLFSVLLGSVFAVLQAAQDAFPYVINGIGLYPDQYPPSVFNTCMGLSTMLGPWDYTFYLIFPILAALPYASSYLQEVKTGYVKNIYLRGKKINYLTAKLLAVFFSGGTAVTLPVLLNFFLVGLCVPAVIPHAATSFFMLFADGTGADIFYTYPHIYVLLFALLLFVTAGILSCSALTFSFLIKNSYAVLLAPFLLFLAISFGSRLLDATSALNISEWIVPAQRVNPLNLHVVILEMGVIFAASVIVYYFRGLKNDTY